MDAKTQNPKNSLMQSGCHNWHLPFSNYDLPSSQVVEHCSSGSFTGADFYALSATALLSAVKRKIAGLEVWALVIVEDKRDAGV